MQGMTQQNNHSVQFYRNNFKGHSKCQVRFIFLSVVELIYALLEEKEKL